MSLGDRSPREQMLWGVLVAALVSITAAAALTVWRTQSSPALPDLGAVPAFELRNHRGNTVSDGTLTGSVWIADFMFTRCQGVCPVLTARMQILADRLGPRPDWRMVSFTIDPDHDTPEVLATYVADHSITQDNWYFLHGPRDTMRSLVVDGFHLLAEDRPDNPREPIVHSPKIVLVDRHGVIRGYYDSQDDEAMEQLRRDTLQLLEG